MSTSRREAQVSAWFGLVALFGFPLYLAVLVVGAWDLVIQYDESVWVAVVSSAVWCLSWVFLWPDIRRTWRQLRWLKRFPAPGQRERAGMN